MAAKDRAWSSPLLSFPSSPSGIASPRKNDAGAEADLLLLLSNLLLSISLTRDDWLRRIFGKS
jgi:hypothetical protein